MNKYSFNKKEDMMPKSKEEFELIRNESREKILSSAIEIFSKKGYSATSINDIAKAANISVGLTYRYFKSKKDLFDTILQIAITALIDITKMLESSGNPKEILESICQMMLDELNNNEYINLCMIIIQSLIIEDDMISQKILYHDRIMFEAAANLIKRGQDEGIFAEGDPMAKSMLLFSSSQGLVLMKLFYKELFKAPTLEEFMAFLYTK